MGETFLLGTSVPEKKLVSPLYMRENGTICTLGVFPKYYSIFTSKLENVMFLECRKGSLGVEKDKSWFLGSK